MQGLEIIESDLKIFNVVVLKNCLEDGNAAMMEQQDTALAVGLLCKLLFSYIAFGHRVYMASSTQNLIHAVQIYNEVVLTYIALYTCLYIV